MKTIKCCSLTALLLFVLTGCGSSSNENDHNRQEPTNHYQSYFINPDDSSSDYSDQSLRNFLSTTNGNLYNHHHVDKAPLLADRFLEEGYFKTGHENLTLEPPIPWGKIFKEDPNYTYGLNAMYPTEQFVFAYRETGKERYLKVAESLHRDWIEQNIHQGIVNRYKWYDMSTGLRTIQLAWLVKELIVLERSPETVLFFLDALSKHIQHLSNPNELGQGNHVIFQMAGIYATCNLLPNFQPCELALPYAQSQFTAELENQFKSDGMHVEHSPSYHVYVVSKIYSLLKTDWYSDSIEQYVEKARQNLAWLYRPEGQLVLLGDSEQMPPNSYSYLSRSLDYLLNDGNQGIIPGTSPALFPETGYGILRTDWREKPFNKHSYLFFNGANHSNVHNHPDFLSIIWTSGGTPILVDSGKYSLDNSDYRNYTKSTRAHNTVQVDRLNMSAAETYPKGSSITSIHHDHNLKVGYVSGTISRNRTSTSHTRHVTMREDKWLLVTDSLHTDKNREFDQWFHFHPSITAKETTASTATYAIGGTANYLHIYDLLNDAAITQFRGSESPMTGWYSPRLFEIQSTESISLSKEGLRSTYQTLLLISDSPTPPALASEGIEFSSSDGRLEFCDQTEPAVCVKITGSTVTLQ